MTEKGVDLARRFRPISSEETKRPSLLFNPSFGGSLGWKDLLVMRRVVVLAEAGSGKSHEFAARRKQITDAGAIACYAAVQDVARAGLEAAIGPKDIGRFKSWQEDDVAPCWFFIDSVDEAKDEGLSFAAALRHLAVAVSGREERAHILISSRFSDWDFITDRASLDEWLTVPGEPPSLEQEDHRDLIRATLSHRQAPKRPEAEDQVHVVLMTALDETRVRQFVENAGVVDADAFVTAVDHGNLWRFASRPLDLEWMANYWHANGALGTLAEMLEASINARLLDPKPARQRRDPLSPEMGCHGLERIGAGLHMSGKDTLRLPSASLVGSATASALSVESLLPDWPRDQQLRLLGRPVFDPATLGRVRIHNDNEGAVRAYLTARWLRGRLAANCPPQVVDDLLFADVYGHRLIRPDMVEVAAWLSLWRRSVADQVIARDPYVLLTKGDPGSLPVAVRIKAIEASLCGRSRWEPWFTVAEDLFRRVADPAFDSVIPDWWTRFSQDKDARHLILRLIWLGEQAGGLDIARQAAFDETLDDVSQVLAGLALTAIGTDADRQRLADHVVTHAARLPRDVVLQGLDRLFPRFLGVDRFFSVIDTIGVKDNDGNKGVYPIGSDVSPDLASDGVLTSFLENIVERIGPLTGDDGAEESAFAEAFDGPATIAAMRLLAIHPNTVPTVITDLVLRLRDQQYNRGIGSIEEQLQAAIVATPERRRASFWQAAAALREHPWIKENDDPNVWQMQHLGWPGTLSVADLDWLIEDMKERADPRDRLLALGGAHGVWREVRDRKILNRIKRAAAADPELHVTLDRWLSPPEESPALRQSMERMKKVQRQNKQRTAKRDNSWLQFVDQLRADPTILDNLNPPTETTVDGRLFHLWQLLSWRTSSRSRHSISDLSMLEPLVGADVTKRFGAALIAFAEGRTPGLPSEKPADQRNIINSFDTMGLAGISLAAATRPGWAQSLSDSAADQAARYAVVELNGFPDYMLALTAAKPAQVTRVLNTEIDCQLAAGNPDGHGMLDRIAYADHSIARLVAPHLQARLDEAAIPAPMLGKTINVLIKAASAENPEYSRMIRDRSLTTAEPEATAQYLALLFAIDGDEAVDCLRARMNAYSPADQTTLCTILLPRLFGDRFRQGELVPFGVTFANLEALVLMAHEGIRREDDIHRESGKVYSPGRRDHAQDARHALFSRLTETPGEATHAALLRLADRPDFPIERDWLLELARRRAVGDAYLQAWRPEDVVQFESEFDKPPSTTAELQLLAIRRIEQIEHDLRHDKFTQGSTLQALPDENAVQRWLGDRFQAMQRHVYTVDRETHVADEKEPDITLHSRFSGVSLPIEIKVIDEMTVPAMERALLTQLCGQYLRHRTARHGILLFVHQRPRPNGWKLNGHSDLVPLTAVLAHIKVKAEVMRTLTPDGPQPIVQCIEVSGAPSLRRKSGARRHPLSSKRNGAKGA